MTANLYDDKNAFFMDGAHTRIPQPAMRDYLGRTFITMQGVNQYELALGSTGDQASSLIFGRQCLDQWARMGIQNRSSIRRQGT